MNNIFTIVHVIVLFSVSVARQCVDETPCNCKIPLTTCYTKLVLEITFFVYLTVPHSDATRTVL